MNKSTTTRRLKSISGQLLGIVAMIENGDTCTSILTQMQASKAGIVGAMMAFVEEEISRCMLEQSIDAKKQEEMSRLLKTLLATK